MSNAMCDVAWLLSGDVQKLIMVVRGVESGEVLERWGFEVQAVKASDENVGSTNVPPSSTKSDKEIMTEIQAIMRQITASVTFLPLLSEACCFDLLVYADKQTSVPGTWADSDPCLILNAEDVRLRSFDTKVNFSFLNTFEGICSYMRHCRYTRSVHRYRTGWTTESDV